MKRNSLNFQLLKKKKKISISHEKESIRFCASQHRNNYLQNRISENRIEKQNK